MLLYLQVQVYINIKKTGFRSPHDAKTPEEKALAKKLEEDDSLDFTAWEMTDYVGNVFNRAVIYAGNIIITLLCNILDIVMNIVECTKLSSFQQKINIF